MIGVWSLLAIAHPSHLYEKPREKLIRSDFNSRAERNSDRPIYSSAGSKLPALIILFKPTSRAMFSIYWMNETYKMMEFT